MAGSIPEGNEREDGDEEENDRDCDTHYTNDLKRQPHSFITLHNITYIRNIIPCSAIELGIQYIPWSPQD